MMIHVVLAEDHTLVRECIRAVIGSSLDITVVAEVDNGAAAVRMAHDLHPDLILMDIGMMGLNGIEATRQIVAQCPTVKVLILSMHKEKRYVMEALHAGANGFLLKSRGSREIIEAIRVVAGNGFYLDPQLKEVIGNDFQRRPPGQHANTVLTPREQEILVLVVNGKRSKDIATSLLISTKTVETHRMHIMKKLNVNNVATLTKYAIREGLLMLD